MNVLNLEELEGGVSAGVGEDEQMSYRGQVAEANDIQAVVEEEGTAMEEVVAAEKVVAEVEEAIVDYHFAVEIPQQKLRIQKRPLKLQ